MVISLFVGIAMIGILASTANAKEDIKTIGFSSEQVLKGVKEKFEIINDQTTDGLPIQYANTEFGFISMELNGKPHDLSFVTIDLLLSESAKEQRDIDNKMIVSNILENIFSKTPEVLDWYYQYLEEGLKQEDRIEQQMETKDKKRYIRLVIVKAANGYIVGIEIRPEPKKSKSKK